MAYDASRTRSRALAAACGAVLLAAAPARAQLIPVRAAPIAEADQFGFFPSANFGMANVSIALDDTLLDPFHNPALASRIRRGLYFGAPTFFSVSNDAGSGQTYPFGGIARWGNTFLTGAVALQEIDPARPRQFFPFGGGPTPLSLSTTPPGTDFEPRPNEDERNGYSHLAVGHTFGSLSLAASGTWSGLRAMEGMELLFTGSHNVRQRGRASDLRLGAVKQWGARSLEAVLVRNAIDMSYDVGYAELYWDPALRQTRVKTAVHQTEDETRVLGMHLAYEMPLADSSWRAGAILTVNRAREAAAPYEPILGVPTDPATSTAFNLGAGVSRRIGDIAFAADAILEPVWRRARAAVDTLTSGSAGILAPGAVARDSYFKFTNVVLRAGVSRDIVMTGTENRLRLQFGTQLRNVNSRMEQHDFVASAFREQRRSWREWTHAWGTNFIFPRFQFAYQLRMLSGMGRLGVPPDDGQVVFVDPFIGPPGLNPGVTLYPVRVVSHQIFFSVPVR